MQTNNDSNYKYEYMISDSTIAALTEYNSALLSDDADHTKADFKNNPSGQRSKESTNVPSASYETNSFQRSEYSYVSTYENF